MNNNILFISAILPSDAPRIKSRLAPILNTNAEVICYRGLKSIRAFLHKVKLMNARAKNNVIVVMDPLALLIWKIFGKKSYKIVYDRNERWPENFRYRQSKLLKIIYFLRYLFLIVERSLVAKVDMMICTDYITKKVLKTKVSSVIIPNRNYNLKLNHSCFDINSDKALYYGTFSQDRGNADIIKLMTKIQLHTQSTFVLDVWTRKIFKYLKANFILYKDYAALDCDHEVFNHKYKFAVCDLTDTYGNNIIPSKVSTYLQLGLPILMIGNNRLANRLSKWMPTAFFNINKDFNERSINAFMYWLTKVHVNYTPNSRKIKIT